MKQQVRELSQDCEFEFELSNEVLEKIATIILQGLIKEFAMQGCENDHHGRRDN